MLIPLFYLFQWLFETLCKKRAQVQERHRAQPVETALGVKGDDKVASDSRSECSTAPSTPRGQEETLPPDVKCKEVFHKASPHQ